MVEDLNRGTNSKTDSILGIHKHVEIGNMKLMFALFVLFFVWR
jgi:hypothetical protein